MSQQVDTPCKAFKASAAISIFARVKIAADGTISTAGIADKEIGIAQSAAFASGDRIQVKLLPGLGTFKAVAAAAITRGVRIYTAASGRVSSTAASTSYPWGTALEAATAAGDIIECLPNMHGDTAN